jgi:flagellar basal body-associated protein FliL
VFGVALGLMPLGLEAISYKLGLEQGYAILAATVLLVIAGIVVFLWPLIHGVWSWLRRDKALRKVEKERDEARATLKTLEQGLEEFGVKMTGDLNTQIAKAKQLTIKLRNGRLEEELRETKRERVDLKDQVARLQTEATSPEAAKQKRRCFHIADQLRGLYGELLDGERLLIAHFQERQEAGVPENELEEERRTKQLELERRIRRTYGHGYSDRLEKLYEELEPDG